jgi:hypothetical protein
MMGNAGGWGTFFRACRNFLLSTTSTVRKISRQEDRNVVIQDLPGIKIDMMLISLSSEIVLLTGYVLGSIKVRSEDIFHGMLSRYFPKEQEFVLVESQE